MNRYRNLAVIILWLFIAAFIVSCSGYTSSTRYGTSSYGIYDDYYRYPYYRYGSRYGDDVNIYVDGDDIEERRKERHEKLRENQPQRRERVESARSRAGSMGIPARAGWGRRR